jgi:hypothetical protein
MVENISPRPPTSPLRYELSFEQLEKDEEETDAALTKTMLGISETTFKERSWLAKRAREESRAADRIVARA